jgi:hypothetical protein
VTGYAVELGEQLLAVASAASQALRLARRQQQREPEGEDLDRPLHGYRISG